MGKQFCVLLKVQLLGAFGINKALHARDSGEKKKLIGFTAMMAFAGVMIVFAIVTYSVLMGIGFQQIGAPELMPAVMMAVASLITLFTTVYKVNGVLFGFRDYDMTMALPVPTAVVVAVRLSQLYLMDLGFSAMVLLPSGIVYAVLNAPPWWFYPLMPVLLLFVPMVPMILALAAGSLITLISSRFRRNAIRRGVRSVSSGSPVYRRPVQGEAALPAAVCAAVGRAVRGLLCADRPDLQESQHRAHHQPHLLPLPDEGAEGIHPAERAV